MKLRLIMDLQIRRYPNDHPLCSLANSTYSSNDINALKCPSLFPSASRQPSSCFSSSESSGSVPRSGVEVCLLVATMRRARSASFSGLVRPRALAVAMLTDHDFRRTYGRDEDPAVVPRLCAVYSQDICRLPWGRPVSDCNSERGVEQQDGRESPSHRCPRLDLTLL